jgi:hypothetical protein
MEGPNSANGAPLIVIRGEQGFRVYSPANPAKSDIVSGDPEHPVCSCSEFLAETPGEYCAHINAVLASFGAQNGAAAEDCYAREERLAIQNEGRTAPDRGRHAGPAVMLLKRSVSPDGRIDSLSVEFTAEVDGATPVEVSDRAARLLALQSTIVKGFLNGARNGSNGSQTKPEQQNEGTGAALAEMVSIGGMDSKWGRRLFIAIQANGRNLRLFGNKNQLAEAIKTAGFAKLAERIEEGVALRVPCRVITKPSPDGKYTNVERLLPVQMPQNNGGSWR